MLPRTISPIATTGRMPQFHEVPLSKTHLVSGSVVRLATFSRARGASSGVGALRSFFTSASVILGESGSTLSDFRGSRVWLLTIAKSRSFSVSVHRTEDSMTRRTSVRSVPDSLELVSAVHDAWEVQLEILVV